MTRAGTAGYRLARALPGGPLTPFGNYREQEIDIFAKIPFVGVWRSDFVYVGRGNAFPDKRSDFIGLQSIVIANAYHPAIDWRGSESVGNRF